MNLKIQNILLITFQLKSTIIGILILFFICVDFQVQAQDGQQIQIIHANSLTGIETPYAKYRKLIGNVQLEHSGVNMFCDSAYDYTERDFFEAYGHIRVIQGDSLTLEGKFLHYDLKEKTAHITGDVKLSDGRMVLSTDKIIYNLKTKTAYYDNKARIVDSTNVLVSDRGHYYAGKKNMVFRGNVKLTNPDNTLSCDSMRYNTGNRTTYFLSPTKIIGKKISVYCEGGWYNTVTKISEFTDHAWINSENQTISGDILHYELKKGYGLAKGHVSLFDSNEKVLVTGKVAEHFKFKKISLITDSALMIKYMSDDTLYIHADTLKVENQAKGDTLIFKAFHNAISYSRQMSYKADSIVYSGSDSTIYFYRKPVIWTGNNQITAKHIKVFLKNKKIDHVYLDEDAFIIGKKDSMRYDQIKGRTMLGYFENNALKKVAVTGNAEAIYYLLDDYQKYIGMNKIESSYINIFMDNKKITGITFINTPTGNVISPKEMASPDSRLKGFNWRGKEKPESIGDLFNK